MPIFERIDKLTNSIENAKTGESFATEVMLVKTSEIMKAEWLFDWKKLIKNPDLQIFKLITKENPKIIHGLISIEDKKDHIFVHHIESAKFNKGKQKVYKGVAGNLFAFACKLSFEMNYDGYISFQSKTKLFEHYKLTLGAERFGSGLLMAIDTKNSKILVNQYFPQ